MMPYLVFAVAVLSTALFATWTVLQCALHVYTRRDSVVCWTAFFTLLVLDCVLAYAFVAESLR